MTKPNFSIIYKLLQLGWPIGVLFVFEVGLFFVASIMMGYFGENALAAHQIALQCSVIAYMIPIGISEATCIRVSLHSGAKNIKQAEGSGYLGVALGLAIAFCTALIYWFGARTMISFFIDKHLAQNFIVV